MIIYKATNLVNGKVYIGQTVKKLTDRRSRHLWDAFNYESNFVFHKALRKYGRENFTWESIDEATSQDELNEKEVYWIDYYKSFGENGYNMTTGGEGKSGFTYTEEAKKKLSDIQKRNPSIRGSNNGQSKLVEEEVSEIKKLLMEGKTSREIAHKFNINEVTISGIKLGRLWRHIGEDLSNLKQAKLTESEILEIKYLLKQGKLNQKEIAKLYSVVPTTISYIKTGKTAKEIGEDLLMSSKSISESTAKEIKLLLAEGKLSQREIANKFNVSEGSITNIKTGKTWRCLEVEGFAIAEPVHVRKLIEEEVIEIKKLLKKGNIHTDIAKKFNVSVNAISRINRGITWSHITV